MIERITNLLTQITSVSAEKWPYIIALAAIILAGVSVCSMHDVATSTTTTP